MSPAIPLPEFDSLVSGDDYHRPTPPTNDAVDLGPYRDRPGDTEDRIPNVPLGQPSPLVAISLATAKEAAPERGAFLLTNLHDDFWLNPEKPVISTESQKG